MDNFYICLKTNYLSTPEASRMKERRHVILKTFLSLWSFSYYDYFYFALA